MQYINRIEIHRFRSFSNVSIPIKDINIYSGVNNSGKSNILKALNLFFNNETSYDSPYDFEKDYNKGYTGQAGGAREIIIQIHFNPLGDGALKYPFSIERKYRVGVRDVQTTYHSTNNEIDRLINEKDDGNIKRQFTRYLGSIEFYYIPAIRDKQFVSHLFLNFEKILGDASSQDASFINTMGELSDIIETRSRSVSKDFESFLNLPTQASLSSDIRDILGSIRINVNTGLQVLKKNPQKGEKSIITDVPVDLFSNGDGILMSYLAYFLAHLSRSQNKRCIWGFEEPENSLEYSKVQLLAQEFLNNFSECAQIFLTTHSPAFIRLKDEELVSFHRVFIDAKKHEEDTPNKRLTQVMSMQQIENLQSSLLEDFDEDGEYQQLERELGMVEMALEIEKAVKAVRSTEDDLRQKLNDAAESLKASQFPNKILIVEDSERKTIEVWKHLLRENDIEGVTVLSSEGCSTNAVENGIKILQGQRSDYKPIIFRSVDRDGLTADQVDFIEQTKKDEMSRLLPECKYIYCVLPVCEIENFALQDSDVDNLSFEDRQAVTDEFERTATSRLNEVLKKYQSVDGNEIFGRINQTISTVQRMRNTSRNNFRVEMPGKAIVGKLNGRLRWKDRIKEMSANDRTSELSAYLDSIKQHFS